MLDIPSINAALISLKSAIDITKMIKESDLSLEKAETKLKFAELIEKLADTKIGLSEIQEIIFNKDKEIKELKDALEIKGKLKYEAPAYYLIDGNSKDGPFCQRCYDKDKLLIRLQGSGDGFFSCSACGKTFTNDIWNRRQEEAIRRGNRYYK